MNIIWKNNLILCSKYSTSHQEMFILSVSDAVQKFAIVPKKKFIVDKVYQNYGFLVTLRELKVDNTWLGCS